MESRKQSEKAEEGEHRELDPESERDSGRFVNRVCGVAGEAGEAEGNCPRGREHRDVIDARAVVQLPSLYEEAELQQQRPGLLEPGQPCAEQEGCAEGESPSEERRCAGLEHPSLAYCGHLGWLSRYVRGGGR